MFWGKKNEDAILTVTHDQLAALADLMSGRIASTQPASVSVELSEENVVRIGARVADAAAQLLVKRFDGAVDKRLTAHFRVEADILATHVADAAAERFAGKLDGITRPALSDDEIDRLAQRLASVVVAPVTVKTVLDAPRASEVLLPTNRGHQHPWTRQEQAELSRLRADGMTYAEIAAQLGRTTMAVKRRAGILGIAKKRSKPVPAPRNVSGIARARWSEADRAEFLRLHSMGISYEEMAVMLRRTPKAMMVRAQQLNLPNRKRGRKRLALVSNGNWAAA